MADPWLTIIGVGEDGLSGLPDASRKALAAAEIVFGGPRHLTLARVGARGRPWPVPFSVEPVLACRGRKVAVLTSGDPFWHGAGGTLAAHLPPASWQAFPAPSVFSLAAARLGWRIEEVLCLGLHAAPFERLLQHLAPGQRFICTLRDGAAPALLAEWLTEQGFGASRLCLLEALGGPKERLRHTAAAGFPLKEIIAPVAMAITAHGAAGLPRASGLEDDEFSHSGQITKRPMRALTLSALAPRAGDYLWDIGAGSGSISVEWALAAPGCHASAIEPRADRLALVRENIARFGLGHRIHPVSGAAPEALGDLDAPDAVFIGGGLSDGLLQALWKRLAPGTRVVANAVTLESQTLLAQWQAAAGGTLMRIDLAQAQPLGKMQGWAPSRPQVQWSVTR